MLSWICGLVDAVFLLFTCVRYTWETDHGIWGLAQLNPVRNHEGMREMLARQEYGQSKVQTPDLILRLTMRTGCCMRVLREIKISDDAIRG
jgi:hypothetical protein